MTDDLYLRRKWTLRAHGHQVVFIKKANESSQHVLMKALLWALYLPGYPNLTVEVAIGDRYKPDLVALDSGGQPRFWGEAGDVRVQKVRSLARRYRSTHFAERSRRNYSFRVDLHAWKNAFEQDTVILRLISTHQYRLNVQ